MSTVVILCLNNALPSGVLGSKDVLALSGMHFVHKSAPSAATAVDWKPTVILASHDGRPITDGHGQSLPVDSELGAIARCDAVLVPGFIPNSEGRPPARITDENTRAWLRKQHRQGALLCGSCSGVFALGEAGVLNGRRCTTTWWLDDELRQRFPKARSQWASELIDDGGVISAGGPLSWVNITLRIIHKLAGQHAAQVVADFSVVDAVPKSQNLYIPEGYQSVKNPFLMKAEYAIRKAHYRPLSVQDLARTMAVSERSLNRKIKQLTQQTPKAFIDGVRISHACTLLVTTQQSVKDIAYSLGYSDDGVFRRLFKQRLRTTPSMYRQQRIQTA